MVFVEKRLNFNFLIEYQNNKKHPLNLKTTLNQIIVFKNQSTNPPDAHRLRDEFIAGDDRAYANIYRLYAKDLYAFGLSLKVSTCLIEDAIHDIFVDIYQHRQNLENVDNLKFYFVAAFRNRLFNLIKKESHTFEVTDKNEYLINDEDKDIQELWIEQETQSEKELLVRNLCSKLNQHQREALYHRFVVGLSCEEVADVMSINYQSAKNLIYRAIKKLRSVGTITFFTILLLCAFL